MGAVLLVISYFNPEKNGLNCQKTNKTCVVEAFKRLYFSDRVGSRFLMFPKS